MAYALLLAAAAIGVTDNPCPGPVPLPTGLEASRNTAISDWPNICHYHADNLRLLSLPAAARDFIFLGDSITEGWAAGDPAFYRDGRINRGISGQTTQQILLRFPADVIALHPRIVHIMAGTNDIAGNTGPTTMDAIEGNIAAMIVLAKGAGIRVVLAATPPCAAFGWAPAIRPAPQIAELNRRLRALAAREKITFVDYNAVLATPEGAMRREYTSDGTHPNAAGYAAMEQVLQSSLAATAQRGAMRLKLLPRSVPNDRNRLGSGRSAFGRQTRQAAIPLVS